jgi:hypothetical protein
VSVSELGPCTAATMVLHRLAPTGTTIITHIRARLTATTGQIGSLAGCSLARDPGFTGVVAIGVADGAVEVSGAALTVVDAGSIADADLPDEADLHGAELLATAPLAVDFVVAAVFPTAAEAGSTVEVGSTVEAAVAFTVAAATAAATGN